MKKRILAVALAATMALASAISAFAATTEVPSTTLDATTSYTEMENPLMGKNAETVTITYTINWAETAARNGWDGIFSFYDAASGGRVSFQTAPYICFNGGTNGTEYWIDAKADAWCTANCVPGQDYTFEYVITADAITVSCDGTAIAEFAETGRGTGAAAEGYQDILDALNTYPTLTIGVGEAVSSYWWTELSTISVTIDDGIAESTDDPVVDDPEVDDPEVDDPEVDEPATDAPATDVPSTETGDVATAAMIVAMVGAAAAVVVLKKRVTE